MRFNTGTCLLVNIEGYTLVSPGYKGWVCCETGSRVVACCCWFVMVCCGTFNNYWCRFNTCKEVVGSWHTIDAFLYNIQCGGVCLCQLYCLLKPVNGESLVCQVQMFYVLFVVLLLLVGCTLSF